jgi:hypothetical protein
MSAMDDKIAQETLKHWELVAWVSIGERLIDVMASLCQELTHTPSASPSPTFLSPSKFWRPIV